MKPGCKYNVTKISLRGSEALNNEIKEHARAAGISANDWILRAIEHDLLDENKDMYSIRFDFPKKPTGNIDVSKIDPEIQATVLSQSMINEYNEIVDVSKKNPTAARTRAIEDMTFLSNFLP